MREIKFRAWDIGKLKMIIGIEIVELLIKQSITALSKDNEDKE